MIVVCGIDLGTTYSSISWYDPDNKRVETIDLNTADGAKVIRSVVYFPGQGQTPVVGDTAWNAAKQYRDRVVDRVKRSMGTAYKTPPIDGIEYTPQQISAEILKVVACDAQKYLGAEVKDVVITVPAYFGDTERAPTEEAGKLAGLNVLGLLPEPHAAALAFAVEKVAEINNRHILVYDLGGGTFDVTLIHTTTSQDPNKPINLQIDTICKEGNASLGGLNFDDALAEIVAEKVKQQFGVDIRKDANNDAFLLDNCEKRKRDLSRTSTTSIVADPAGHQVDVSVSEFEDRTRDLLLQTKMLMEHVLDDAEKKHGIKRDQIEVMLTGGASRMPMVARMIEGLMGKPPFQHRNPELLVTIGAAYWAHLIQGKKSDPNRENPIEVIVKDQDGTVRKESVQVKTGGLTDISFYAVGVAVLRPDGQGSMKEVNAVIVPNGTKYGAEFKKEFQTSEDNMKEIPIILYKGESERIDECQPIMTFTITGLPSGLKRGTRVFVTLGYDDSGIIRGSAIAQTGGSGHKVDIVVDRSNIPA